MGGGRRLCGERLGSPMLHERAHVTPQGESRMRARSAYTRARAALKQHSNHSSHCNPYAAGTKNSSHCSPHAARSKMGKKNRKKQDDGDYFASLGAPTENAVDDAAAEKAEAAAAYIKALQQQKQQQAADHSVYTVPPHPLARCLLGCFGATS